ncbi:hypothetical protein MTR_5g093945 [Medicago truncatula]|uniref:Uncharacterized protein n=1 Tax=Medicago truncatula TaxID=3880 RepID=A0A072UFB6_MEDTR|nr:hypothetical protein MTR_5g093945 [Medicago truncatula]
MASIMLFVTTCIHPNCRWRVQAAVREASDFSRMPRTYQPSSWGHNRNFWKDRDPKVQLSL